MYQYSMHIVRVISCAMNSTYESSATVHISWRQMLQLMKIHLHETIVKMYVITITTHKDPTNFSFFMRDTIPLKWCYEMQFFVSVVTSYNANVHI